VKHSELESRMRAGEIFHALRAPPGAWLVVRTDGRSFSKLTEERYEKPFDPAFHGHMVRAASSLLEELGALYVYTESDEISVLLAPGWDLFDREVEKIVSVSAGISSSAYTLSAGHAAHFDSRVWVAGNEHDVVDYFRWRQADAARCALNGWCYWVLRNAGKSVGDATAVLRGASKADKNELLFRHGINFNDVPTWQRRGAGVYWEEFQKEGVNPITQVRTVATRRRIRVDEELPMGDEYARFLGAFLASTGSGREGEVDADE
jgi:tRNA(His) guanylyltransferase